MPKSKTRKKSGRRRGPTPSSKPAQVVRTKGPSPKWYIAIMFGLMAVGTVVIVVNYIGLLPGGTSNRWLFTGLGGIAVGFVMTLNYR